MKTKLMIFLLAALSIISCRKGKDDISPSPTMKYYVIAKVDSSSWFNIQSNTLSNYEESSSYDGVYDDMSMGVTMGPSGDDVDVNIIFYLDPEKQYISNSMIMGLKGKSIPFDSAGGASVSAEIDVKMDNKYLGTDNAENKTGSLYISDIKTYDYYTMGSLYTAYVLTGTFTCTVDNYTNTNPKSFTEGKFSLLFNP